MGGSGLSDLSFLRVPRVRVLVFRTMDVPRGMSPTVTKSVRGRMQLGLTNRYLSGPRITHVAPSCTRSPRAARRQLCVDVVRLGASGGSCLTKLSEV